MIVCGQLIGSTESLRVKRVQILILKFLNLDGNVADGRYYSEFDVILKYTVSMRSHCYRTREYSHFTIKFNTGQVQANT